MDIYATSAADEAFLLDLLNTTPVVDGVPTDALADPAASSAWMTDHGVPATDKEHGALTGVRAALHAVIRGDESAEILQPFLAQARLVPTMTDGGIDWRLDGETTGAIRAAVAWDGLRIASPGRLRPCANTDCHLFLIDRSKPNTARWCSMAMCGNRMKARRHYQRSRS